MQIVQGDERPIEKGQAIRSGTLDRRVVVRGEVGTPGNFVLGIYYQTGDFLSPRHRHNFDQFRFQIEGECDFARNGKMKTGVLGYFPEGAFYGPQSADKPNVTAVVQFGGPSGSGYLSTDQVATSSSELRKFGVFEKGIYHRNPGVPGKKNLDGYQAVWEHANQRPLVYPKPQYSDPILMNADHHRWMPLADAPGVAEKALGIFTNCKIRCARYKLDPGASFVATGRGLFMVVSGRGSVEGQPARPLTTAYLKDGERATFAADETTEILLMGLPDTALIAKEPPREAAREAAE